MTAFPSPYRIVGDAAPPPVLPVAGPTGAALVDNPLSATHRRELAAARDRAKSIRKASRVAAFNGWTMAIIAALSGASALFDTSGLLITVGLAFVAFNEFRGRKRLLHFDPSAATMLGWNQLGLLAMVIVYCLWTLYGSFGQSGAVAAELKSYADLDAALGAAGGFEDLYKSVVLAVYVSVIVLSILFQGGNAFYYFTRRRLIDDYIAETPAWVREVQSGS